MGRGEHKHTIYDAFNRAYTLTDYKVHNNLDKRYEFRKKIISEDEFLEDDERKEAIKILDKRYDYDKIISEEGTKRICENCNQECLATSYCERCIRRYLKANFSNWESGNDKIDNIIQKCQEESIGPNKIIEWISSDEFKDWKYLNKGGFSEIYAATWNEGHYNEWDSKEQKLKRSGEEEVALKCLEDVESADRSWFDEAKSHLTISNKWAGIVQCYGLTKCPLYGNYMIVMKKLDIDLKNYLQQNHNHDSWKEKIKINVDIIDALLRIHKENAVHRDLHSGNILYSKSHDYWFISDLGFCGPVNKPLGSIYGNIPYVAPEVIIGKEYSKASDIYSIGMLMWEISSGRSPFIRYRHDDYELAMKIVNGMRPKIVPGTPLEYKELMEQCWDADPSKRPDTDELWKRMMKINKSYQPNQLDESNSFQTNNNSLLGANVNLSSLSISSKVYNFNNLTSEPRNATKEEQEAYHEEEELYNNSNFHPEDQDELEILNE